MFDLFLAVTVFVCAMMFQAHPSVTMVNNIGHAWTITFSILRITYVNTTDQLVYLKCYAYIITKIHYRIRHISTIAFIRIRVIQTYVRYLLNRVTHWC